MQPSRAGAWKPTNRTSEWVSGKPGMGPASRSQAAVLCPPCINSCPLRCCVMHSPSYLSPLPLSSSGPSKSWPWKSKLRYLLFGTSSTALALGTADNLNFRTRVIEVGLEKQRWVIQPLSVPGSTGPRSPAVALSRAAHPRVAGDCRPCICTGIVPRDAAETFREGSTKLRLGWWWERMLELKGNQDTLGEERGGSLLLSFLCRVASPIKGIYYSPTHHWAGEEVCDSFHIPCTGRVGKEKDGKILLSHSLRQSSRDRGT